MTERTGRRGRALLALLAVAAVVASLVGGPLPASDAQEASPGRLLGRVARVDGSPVAGVVVDRFAVDSAGGRAEFLESARSDGEGQVGFALAELGCSVTVSIAPDGSRFVDGARWDEQTVCTTGEEPTARFLSLVDGADGSSLGGRVTTEAGGAVAGLTADVFLTNADGTRGLFLGDTVTGDDGRYRFELMAGCYVVVLIAPAERTFVDGGRWAERSACISPDRNRSDLDATLGAGTVPPPPPPPDEPPPGGDVVWEEHFDRLDTSRWVPEHSTYGDGNDELQCYRPENVRVESGRLVLQAVTETYTCPNGSARRVTSGMVRSRGLTFEPGQAIEFRVKLTPADESAQGGLWPAVWSSAFAPGGWPRGGEIDFLEVMTAVDPTRSIYSIHYLRPNGSHGVTNKPVFDSVPFSAEWHTVRFEYGRNGRLVWYLDGRQVFAVDDADTVQGYPAPFDTAIQEIKINLALGGRPGPLDPGAVGSQGATFEVDYIRVVRL